MKNLVQKAYEVCLAIEACGASEKLTDANLKAYDLYKAVQSLGEQRGGLAQRMMEVAAYLRGSKSDLARDAAVDCDNAARALLAASPADQAEDARAVVWKLRYPKMQALDRIALPTFTDDPKRMRELVNAGATAIEYRALSGKTME